MGGKKKGKTGAEKPIVNATSNQGQGKEKGNKEEEMQKIMAAINNMDLDKKEFIDIASFDQSKSILENALDDLQHYLQMFEKG